MSNIMKITEKDGFSQTWERQIWNAQLLSFQMRYDMSFEHPDPFQLPVIKRTRTDLRFKVHRKSMHSDLNHQLDSNHTRASKMAVVVGLSLSLCNA